MINPFGACYENPTWSYGSASSAGCKRYACVLLHWKVPQCRVALYKGSTWASISLCRIDGPVDRQVAVLTWSPVV